MLRLLVAVVLIQGTNSIVPQEISLVSVDGQEYYLDGYNAHDVFSTGITQIFADKVKKAIEHFLPTPAILQDLSYMEYTFIHLIYGLLKSDRVYSNIFIEFLSTKNPQSQSIISPFLLSKIKLTQEEYFLIIKELVNNTNLGLFNVPHFLSQEFIKLDNKYRIFKKACSEGNIDVVEWFCENGYEMRSLPLNTELLLTTWDSSQWPIIKLLIKYGILLQGLTLRMTKLTNSKNESLLHFIAETNSPSTAMSIDNSVNAGLDINSLDVNGCSPLCRALTVNNSLEIIEELLSKGALVNTESEKQNNLLSIAVENRNIPAVKLLLKRGASSTEKDKYGISALQNSEILGLSTVILQLQEKELPIAEIDNLNSLLSMFWQSSFICKTLLTGYPKEKFSFDNLNSWTESLPVITKLLLPEKEENFGFKSEKVSLLNLVVIYGNDSFGAASYLLNTLNDPVKAIDENQLLLAASAKGDENVVNLLLKTGCTIDLQNSENETALYEATRRGYENVVVALLENKANVNITTIDGVTPLHAAAENGYLDIVKILVQRHANVSAVNKNGQTALHLAINSNKLSVVEYLLSINSSNNSSS